MLHSEIKDWNKQTDKQESHRIILGLQLHSPHHRMGREGGSAPLVLQPLSFARVARRLLSSPYCLSPSSHCQYSASPGLSTKCMWIPKDFHPHSHFWLSSATIQFPCLFPDTAAPQGPPSHQSHPLLFTWLPEHWRPASTVGFTPHHDSDIKHTRNWT